MQYFKLLMLSVFSLPAIASEYESDYLSVSFENDVFFDDDGGYSNALVFNWGYYDIPALDQKSLPTWISALAEQTYLPFLPDREYSLRYTVGHFIQTATEIKEEELTKADAPYVGLLAWEVNATAYNDAIYDDLSLTLGVVGPAAGGEYIQKNLHSVIGANEPLGWDYQIDNELVFRAQARRVWRNFVMPVGNTEIDVISGVNVGVGNLLSDARAGGGIRWGQKLQSSFSTSSPFVIQKMNGLMASPDGWHLFANISSAYVLNDIFINGNTFKNSHRVELVHWQTAVSAGAQLNLDNWNFIYTFIYATDEYETQTEDTRFGNISVTYNF